MWRFLNFDISGFGDVPKSLVGPGVRFEDVPTVHEITDAQYRAADGVIVRLGTTLDGTTLAKFSRLRMVASVTTGLDHIDVDYCHRRGITILSLRGETRFLESITSTPEMTWALLLALVRKLPQANAAVLAGSWTREPFFGHQLSGKSLGIIGFGRIGKILGRFGHAFGMRVFAFDKVHAEPQSYPCEQVGLGELLSHSHVVSVNLPLADDTLRFVGASELGRMRSDAWLINTARGGIVDEAALLEALETGRIAGAAVDVIEHETVAGHVSVSHPLVQYARSHDNLLISPHIGGSTFEAMESTARFIAGKISVALGDHA